MYYTDKGTHALTCKLQMEIINKRYDFTFLVLFLNLLWCEVKWILYYDAKTTFKSTFPACRGLSRRRKNDGPLLAGKSRRFNRCWFHNALCTPRLRAVSYIFSLRSYCTRNLSTRAGVTWNDLKIEHYTFFISGKIALNLFPFRKFTAVSFCKRDIRGTQRGYSSKPLNIALLNVF